MSDGITADLRSLNALAKIMKRRRIERGALTLASPEVKFKLERESESSTPTDVGMYEIREANQMVEEFMLAANIAVAEKILTHYPLCALLRRHPAPSPAMFDPLLATAQAVGLDVNTASSRTLADSLDRAVVRGRGGGGCGGWVVGLGWGGVSGGNKGRWVGWGEKGNVAKGRYWQNAVE